MNVKSRVISIPAGRDEIQGNLHIPERSSSIIVFAHGSGSGRHRPRNQYVADVFNEAGMSSLLIDPLTSDEELVDSQTGFHRFDIDMPASRLSTVAQWLRRQSTTSKLRVGYFGASTGAAAALVAAAKYPDIVEAIVSRGGRPDLAESWLTKVRAPVLMIVGGSDRVVAGLNYQAAAELKAEHRVEIVPNAGHLFNEPGALEMAAALARDWFEDHLVLANRRAA